MSEAKDFPTITSYLPKRDSTETDARLAALKREATYKREEREARAKFPNPHGETYPGPGKIHHSPYDRIVKP